MAPRAWQNEVALAEQLASQGLLLATNGRAYRG